MHARPAALRLRVPAHHKTEPGITCWRLRELSQEELLAAVAWARQQVAAGHPVLMNCAQGKSRSGSLATAYLMQTRDLSFDDALAQVKQGRSMVQPNPGFERQLRSMEASIRLVALPVGLGPASAE